MTIIRKRKWDIGRILNIINVYAYSYGHKRREAANMLKEYGVEVVNEKD